jgi:hypothetical protein
MLPSKEVLKEKYKIVDDDFEILTEYPADGQIKARGGFLLRVGELLGAPTWLWKTFSGTVLAVIILISSAIGHYNNLQPIVVHSYEKMALYLQELKPIKSNEHITYVAFVPPEFKMPEPPGQTNYTDFPPGSAVFPVSGSWQV